MRLLNDDFDITKPPAPGHEDVGAWAWELYELSRSWRDDELNMQDVWRANHLLYRGNHWGSRKKKNDITIGLNFSNIQRTVANIVSKSPVAEVIDLDGENAEYAAVASAKIKKWWLDSKQLSKLRTSVLNCEIYGITWEKIVWSALANEPKTVVCDPYAIFPYPGYYEDMSADCPAICHATAEDPSVIQKQYNTTEDVEISETYTLLGGEREETIGQSAFSGRATTNTGHGTEMFSTRSMGNRGERALKVEVWFRDTTGDYPGDIRVITVTNEGKLVLSDIPNPNINQAFPPEIQENNYLFRRFPFYKNNSYTDTTSIFGFSAAEQTAQLNIKIDELMSRLVDYAMRAMTGILIIPETAAIPKNAVDSRPGLVLRPKTDIGGQGIRFVPLPNPPAALFQILDLLINLHDRVHAIEDVDRGQKPTGVTAASAIVAMQERNAALIQYKIDATDSMVASRGKGWLALQQMHGHTQSSIKVNDMAVPFQGDQLAGMEFDYVVESGSSLAKTSVQLEAQTIDLANMGMLDQQAVLETFNYPNNGEIIERMAEDQLGQAMQILVQAGMPEGLVPQMMEVLQQAQGGPGNRPDAQAAYQAKSGGGSQPKPGMPKIQQRTI